LIQVKIISFYFLKKAFCIFFKIKSGEFQIDIHIFKIALGPSAQLNPAAYGRKLGSSCGATPNILG